MIIPTVYGEVTIETAEGSGAPGCETTAEGCFSPNLIIINPNEIVTWKNTDTAAHTYTSGNSQSGFDGLFDSGLVMAGNTYSFTFEEAGNYDYFCMVHPWMVGSVMVGIDETSNSEDQPSIPEPDENNDTLEIENGKLRDELTDLKLENRQLKNQLDSANERIEELEDQILAMTSEFIEMVSQLNEWFRSQLDG